ncbi:MAG TPA: hypothetical protein VJX67_16560 [Blastocatellia bacterium]|nr:hypothetical protein [Blastocatellia bacterium]
MNLPVPQTAQRRTDVTIPRGRAPFLKAAAGLLPALAVVALPKCPFCLLAYFGILGSFGLGASLYQSWLLPISLILLGAVVAMLAFSARRRRGYALLASGLLGAVSILGGKFYFDSAGLIYGGVAVLVLATIFDWLRGLSRSGVPYSYLHQGVRSDLPDRTSNA